MTTYQRIFIGTLAALAAASCTDADTTPRGELGSVRGRLVAADARATSASLVAIDDDGATTVVASGAITADGRFRIDDIPPSDGPFIVRVDGTATIIGAVVIPSDVTAGDTTTTLPIDHETTVEAEAYVALLAGDAARATVDVVGLLTWIDAALAARADSAATLAAAWWSAQEGWIAVTAVSATAAAEARLDAWADLTLRADAEGAVTSAARRDFIVQSQADLMARLDLTAGAHADAQAAAAILFEAALTGDAALRDAAARVGAELSAHASWAAQVAASAGSSAEVTIAARLTSAYARFFDALAEADDADAMADAWLQLSGAISGHGASDGARAALDLLADAEAGVDADALEAALAATTEARATFDADLQAALAGSAEVRASAVAAAFVELRAALAATIAGSLATASDRVEAFVVASATQIHGAMGALFDLDVLSDLEVGVTIVGAIAAELGARVDAATLVALDAAGAARVVAEGVVAGGQYRFEGVATTGATLVVELTDASGELVGAALAGADVTVESTVETLVFLARVDEGERPSAIDLAFIARLVDADLAAAATTDGGATATLARATLAAELIADATAAATTPERARAEAALAFGLAVTTATDVSANLVAAADARADAEAGLALDAAIARLSGSGLASLTHVLDLGTGELVADVAAALALDASGEAALSLAIEQALAAGATFEASARAAITTTAAASFDGLVAAWSTARATFDAAVAVALALPTVTLSEADHAALVTVVTHLALGAEVGARR